MVKKILAVNLRTEIFHLIFEKDCELLDKETIMECSDFAVCNDQSVIKHLETKINEISFQNNILKKYAVMHNEDSILYVYDTGYFVSAKVISTEYKK